MKVQLITDTGALDAAIDGAIKQSGTLSKRLHRVLCSLHSQVIEHGDIRPFVRLCEGLEEGAVKVNAIKLWMTKYTPIQAREEDGKFVEFVLDKDIRDRQAKARTDFVTTAMGTPFWLLKSTEGEDFKAMDVFKTVHALIKRLEKDALVGEDVDHTSLIAALGTEVLGYEPIEA